MSLVDGAKKLEPPMFILFVASKFILGVGLGVILAGALAGAGWWLFIIGLVLSIFVGSKIIANK